MSKKYTRDERRSYDRARRERLRAAQQQRTSDVELSRVAAAWPGNVEAQALDAQQEARTPGGRRRGAVLVGQVQMWREVLALWGRCNKRGTNFAEGLERIGEKLQEAAAGLMQGNPLFTIVITVEQAQRWGVPELAGRTADVLPAGVFVDGGMVAGECTAGALISEAFIGEALISGAGGTC